MVDNILDIISEIEKSETYKNWVFVNTIFSIINQHKCGRELSPKQIKALEAFLIKENGINYEDYYSYDPMWD